MTIERIGNATLYLGDCRDILPTLPKVDAVITDPPYGIGESRAKNQSRGAVRVGRKQLTAARDYGEDGWDDQPVPTDLMDMVVKAGKWAIVFGGNYYPMPPSSCWLVWDKENGENDFADCELAWTNIPKAVRRIRYMWHGMLRANGEQRGDHPTQKPIGVMKWAISHAPRSETILDPFMGSGTTGVAAMQLGRQFTGIELRPDYFATACRRIEDAQRQARMFA